MEFILGMITGTFLTLLGFAINYVLTIRAEDKQAEQYEQQQGAFYD